MLALDASPLICSKRQIATATTSHVCGVVSDWCDISRFQTVKPYGDDSNMILRLLTIAQLMFVWAGQKVKEIQVASLFELLF